MGSSTKTIAAMATDKNSNGFNFGTTTNVGGSFGNRFEGQRFAGATTAVVAAFQKQVPDFLRTTVPVLSCGGLTKRFLVPGWRMGWIVIYDRNNVFDHEVRKGLLCMSQRIIGSNTLVQGALPTILKSTPQSFFDNTISFVKKNAEIAFKKLRSVPGLMPVMPQGAMYMMVRVDMTRFPGITSDL